MTDLRTEAALLALRWPAPGDPASGERLLERFAELGEAERTLAQTAAGSGMLRCLGGNSPYLSDLAIREHDCVLTLARDGPDAVADAEMAVLHQLPPTLPRPRLAAALRQAKRRIALAVALGDIGGLWPLDRVTASLSDFAEASLRLSVAHLLRAGHESGELLLPDPADPGRGSGFVVLGMGKLGARELNYSSDVDLVLLQDPDSGVYHGESAGAFYLRLSRGLVALMEARDADGYVFRTDLRLRPDPGATPPCIALPAAIAYYESMGQNWERAAMLKARPVAGDLALGAAFLDAIRPFVWRRHLDFAALADIHAMKRRIDARGGAAEQSDPIARVLGRNIKLGQGGIREIEFLAQTLQLVWGGRAPGLRTPRTLDALAALTRAGHLPRRRAAELAEAYRFLRNLEHRLQMVADRQTHDLPATPGALDRFAPFFGMADGRALATGVLRHADRVRAAYRDVFEVLPGADDPAAPCLDFSGPGVDEATQAALAAMGYAQPDAVIASVRGWLAGRLRALRSDRSRDLMGAVLPRLLADLGRQPQPDSAFARFDAFLARLPAGVQLLSLFQRNPSLLTRVAAILGAAPSLADHLARSPAALEGLLTMDDQPDLRLLLRRRLQDAATLEEAIAIIRSTVREEDFAISVATMEARLDADEAGVRRAALADAAMLALLPRVLDDFAARFGRVRGGGMVVVLLGKAGSREAMAGSDLDLMLVYDHPPTVAESSGPDGTRSMAASQWFIRAVHAFVAALTAPDAAGPMFAVDMRLRPSGNKGPVAVSLPAFRAYHAPGGGAWTWERMALTRARVIGGPPGLRARVRAAVADALAHAGPPEKVLADAAAMRARMRKDLPQAGLWDVKHRPGGQIDVEFIAQALLLAHPQAARDPDQTATRAILAALADHGALAPDAAAVLIPADRTWRCVMGLLRITVGAAPPPDLPSSTLAPLLTCSEAVDLAGLQTTMESLGQQVATLFAAVIGRFME